MSKIFVPIMILLLASSSILLFESASAQTIPKPAIPEFTLKYIDNSYDVPPKTTSSPDPYTGKVTYETIPGYHVQNKSVELIIKNQPFTSYLNENGSRVGLFYYLASKGHYGNWSTIDANYWLKQKLSESYPPFIARSDSQYTVRTLTLGNISDDGKVDYRIQAIIGYSTRINTTFSGPPIGLEPGESYHYHTFTGEVSDWSNTQTLNLADGSISISTSPTPNPTPTPSVPEFSWLIIVPLLLSVFSIALLVRRRKNRLT